MPSRSPQAPAPIRRETRSATALAHSAALPGHDPTASKPPAQCRELPPLLSRPTPLHVAPPTAAGLGCRESWVAVKPYLWNTVATPAKS